MTFRIDRRAIVLVAAALAFGGGLASPPAPGAQGGLPEQVLAAPDALPGATDAWNCYYRVMRELKDRYYGELPSETRLTYHAIRGLMRTVDDPFTRFMDPEEYREQNEENIGEFVGIGAYLDERPGTQGYVAIQRCLPDGPAARAGLRARDAIVRVDNRPVKGATTEQLSQWIRGTPGSTVRLTISRPKVKRLLVYRVVRRKVEFEVVDYGMKEGKIGYARLSLFNQHSDNQIVQAVRVLEKQGMRGFVLDLRGNPGGILESATALVSRFVKGKADAVIIVEAGGRREEQKVDPRKFLGLKVPLVVLVDGDSASAAEILAGAIKDNKAGTLIGETTFGKGLVQSVLELPGGSAVAITSANYLTSGGNDINRTRTRRGGVTPDIPVPMTEKDLFLGTDPQLARATQYLNQRSGDRAQRPR